jgi:hypothetical protein
MYQLPTPTAMQKPYHNESSGNGQPFGQEWLRYVISGFYVTSLINLLVRGLPTRGFVVFCNA